MTCYCAFVFHKRCFHTIYKMGPKKGGRNVRKIEVLTNTRTEFELGDTADIAEEDGGE